MDEPERELQVLLEGLERLIDRYAGCPVLDVFHADLLVARQHLQDRCRVCSRWQDTLR